MKLTPIEDSEPAREVLTEAGLLPPSNGSSTREISKFLDHYGASVPELAQQISTLSKCAQDDSIKLRAVELGLKAHGILEKHEGQVAPQIVFIGADQSIVNVLIPR